MDTRSLDRREALRRLAVGGVAAATLPAWVDTLCAVAVDHAHAHGQRKAGATAAAASAWKPRILTAAQNDAVVTISELIIPQTKTAGAKAAKVNEFIDGALASAGPTERARFLDGLRWLDDRAKQDFSTATFVAATLAQQTALLTTISAPEAKTSADKTGAEFFDAIKSMTIVGYYTSEPGMREEMGDDGTLFFAEFKGCAHPEHRDA